MSKHFTSKAVHQDVGRSKVLGPYVESYTDYLTPVLTHVESEEIKAIVDVRDLSLLFREFQTTLPEKGHHRGFHLNFQ